MELSEQQIADKVIARLLENDLEIFKTIIPKVQTSNSANSKTDHSKIKEKITELVKCKLHKSKPNSNQLYYKTDLEVCGLSDILYTIASIIRISIVALDNSYTGDDNQVLQFHSTIRYSLDLVLQLLPFDEMDCLEAIIELYILPNEILGKEEVNKMEGQ